LSAPRYAAITVTYHPELPVLERQLAGLTEAAIVVVVDNASAAATVEALRGVVAPPRILITHGRNEGLAAGLNAGARAALEHDPRCEYLLFLDQDTEPAAGAVRRLVLAAAALRRDDPRAGLFGPLMIDVATGLSHGAHQIRGWRWVRAYPGPDDDRPLRCAAVNGSGMLVPVAVFREVGGVDERLFIDHVDTEYSFRVAAAGHHLYTVPDARFGHRMGERSLRFWLGGWRVWPHRSPARHYYLFRNAVWLMRRPYVPAVWKGWAAAKLFVTAAAHLAADPMRVAQLRAMARGLREGLRSAPGGRR
jgi:rhamnosyltransferase